MGLNHCSGLFVYYLSLSSLLSANVEWTQNLFGTGSGAAHSIIEYNNFLRCFMVERDLFQHGSAVQKSKSQIT